VVSGRACFQEEGRDGGIRKTHVKKKEAIGSNVWGGNRGAKHVCRQGTEADRSGKRENQLGKEKKQTDVERGS